jgi:hypothetical protein
VVQTVTAKQLAEMREQGYRADSGSALEGIGVIDQAEEAYQPRRSGIQAITFTEMSTGESVTVTAKAAERIDQAVAAMPLKAPSESQFGEDDDFIPSTALTERAAVLAKRHRSLLGHYEGLSVLFLWKRTGGKSKGKGVFGKTVKPSGLLKRFAQTEFVIWLAADHCREARYGDREIEALLFHEMNHIGMSDEDDDGNPSVPVLVPHDVEMFRSEVEVYGLWDEQLRDVAPAFKQAALL